IDDKVAKALDHPEMLRVIYKIVGEVVAVAATVKGPLATDMADKVVRWTQESREIHTSMYDDWKAGRPTEIDFLNGYVAKIGRQFGIPTPLNDMLTAVIKSVTERDRTGPEIVRIEGAVVQPVSLDRAAIASLPAEHHIDILTVMPGMQGKGIRLKALLDVPALA